MERKKLLALGKHLEKLEHWKALSGGRPARGYKLLDDWDRWDQVPRKFTMAFYFVRYYTKDGLKRGIAGGIAAHGFGLDGVGFGDQEYHIDDIVDQFATVFDVPTEVSRLLCLPPQRYNEAKDQNGWDYLAKITPQEAAHAVFQVRGGHQRLQDIWGPCFERLRLSPPRKHAEHPKQITIENGEIIRPNKGEQITKVPANLLHYHGIRGGYGKKLIDGEITGIYVTKD